MAESFSENEHEEHKFDGILETFDKSVVLEESGKPEKSLVDSERDWCEREAENEYSFNETDNASEFGARPRIEGRKLNWQKVYLPSNPEHNSKTVLCGFISECMKQADQSGHTSIGFVALGTGAMMYPPVCVARIMYHKVMEYSNSNPHCKVQHVHFVLYPEDQGIIQDYKKCEKELLTSTKHLNESDIRTGPIITRNKMQISIVEDDIGKHKADVLVVACHRSLDLNKSGRSAKSLFNCGGDDLQKGAWTKYPNGITNYGELATIPGGHNLNCQEVYLTFIPLWQQKFFVFSLTSDKAIEILCGFVTACLTQADKSGYTSIGFAAMGTGAMSYPPGLVAMTMYNKVMEYSNNNPNCKVQHVQFVLYPGGQRTIQAFEAFEKELFMESNDSSDSDTRMGPIVTRNKMQISIVKDDIGKHTADVLVVACDMSLDFNKSGAAAKSLYDSGGDELQIGAWVKYPNGITNNGDFASIPGTSNLNCQEVYLTSISPLKLTYFVSPRSFDKTQKVLCGFISECMKQADQSGHTSIGFVALGTGVMMYPPSLVAENMYHTVMEYSQSNPNCKVEHIQFILHPEDQNTIQAFEKCENIASTGILSKGSRNINSRTGPIVTKYKMQISIVKGDIGKHAADVLVVACDKSLDLNKSGEAAKSLYDCGGDELQKGASVKYPNGITNYGDFASIPGGSNLNCREVYLTSIPPWEQKYFLIPGDVFRSNTDGVSLSNDDDDESIGENQQSDAQETDNDMPDQSQD